MLRHIYKASAILMVSFLFAWNAVAEEGTTVVFGCDAWKGSVCHFMIKHISGDVTKFEIPAETKKLVENVTLRKDNYCVCVNTAPPEELAQCKRGYKETFCKATTVLQGYNN